MAKIRYCVATSLDGYISGPNGESDWIVVDPEFDFAALWAQFDVLLMGRRTYEAATARLGKASFNNFAVFVMSRTLKAEDHPGISIVRDLSPAFVESLRAQAKKDIWLMGGGEAAQQLLELHQVDTVEVSLIPVFLGGGTAVVQGHAPTARLRLVSERAYKKSGTVSLVYAVDR